MPPTAKVGEIIEAAGMRVVVTHVEGANVHFEPLTTWLASKAMVGDETLGEFLDKYDLELKERDAKRG